MASFPAEFIVLESVDSTNNYAMGLVHKGLAVHGTVCFTYNQFAGKGRLGKVWTTEPGANIITSIILKPSLSVSYQFQISVVVSVAIHKLLTKYIEGVKIKWPNDLYWRDSKAGGVLIENVLQGTDWLWAIAGIGINVNQTAFSPNLPNPVSLKQVTGNDYDVLILAGELRQMVLAEHADLEKNGFAPVHNYYNANLYKAGVKVKLRRGNATFETTVKNVGSDGRLVVVDTMERSFGLDEIEWVL